MGRKNWTAEQIAANSVIPDTSWMKKGNCAGLGFEVMNPTAAKKVGGKAPIGHDPKVNPRSRQEKQEWARDRYCLTDCAVKEECLAYAIATAQTHGVWGGLTEMDRQEMVNEAGTNQYEMLNGRY